MKLFKRILSASLALVMSFSCVAFSTTFVSAAPSVSAGWNESLYAEWVDPNPDSPDVQVGYKLSTDDQYTYLTGNDLTYLVRQASTSGYGRVDIPGLKSGRYDIYIKASDGTEHTRTGIKVYEYDRSGYAHFNYTEGIGGYNNDGTLKDNAIVVYVTDENKDTFEVPGYEGHAPISYHSNSTGADWTRTTEGIGNLLNNNMKFIQEITITDNHPLVIRFIGKVNVPKNLTPYNIKDNALGGSKGDNGNLAICKYGRNITLEGIGEDAVIEGWGFTFAQTSTCPAEAGKSFEVRNLTFNKYSEDGLGFQGDDGITCPIERVWVHNNTFYPGYCANPAESDKGEGDGSCDFKRGQYYTMSYNHYINCHKTNLVGSGTSDDQFYISLHHNYYQNVGSRQPLAANGNMHIYSTYFEGATSTSVDLRGKNSVLLEENYYDNCKSNFKSRNATCIAKSYNEIFNGSGKYETKGTRTVVSSKDEAVLTGSGYTFPDGTSIDNFDLDSSKFYKDSYIVTPAAEVPEYVKTYAGTLKAFPVTESGEITITVTSDGKAVEDASVTANGLTFVNRGSGIYSASASLGSEYIIKVSKEGYSNVVIKSTVLNTDGETFTASADLQPDYDGYAVVKLTGGSDNQPVKGADVKLTDGTVLIDQNDGTYKSEQQLSLGEKSVVITDTGDYISPASPQTIVVKTTDEATEIHLDKAKGLVSVTLCPAEGETKVLDASGAIVYVGSTALSYAGDNTFTGSVDINSTFDVSVSIGGWHLEAISPSQLTASKEGTASATATLKAGGALYTWNYTENINTDDFYTLTGDFQDWGDASKNPQTFDGETLTKAVKLSSNRTITFNAPVDGTLTIIAHNRDKAGTTIDINGDSLPISIGENKTTVSAGQVTIKKGKNESCIYLIQYEMGDSTPTPTPTTTESTTESTTVETQTEISTQTVPVEYGEAVTNSGTGISVTYDSNNDTWTLTDSSKTLAADLNIPFKAPVTSGKVIVKGSATPSAASGKWAFLKIMGPEGADGAATEVAALATDSSKNITLRTDGLTYAQSSAAVTANKTYNYEFIIDMDQKTVELTFDNTTYTGTITASELTGIASVTSVTGERNVTLTTPYVGLITETASLTDDIMWDVTADLTPEDNNGLTLGETFYTNSEENGPVDFTDGDNTYSLDTWLQPKTNPYDSNGLAPMNQTNPTGIPVTGGFAKFVPTSDGAFTMAVKTGGGKITYVTDENGSVVTKLDNSDGYTSYDIVRFNVQAGKTYYIFANSSKICLYYLGYTAGKTVPTESSSETSSVTESSSETTTDTETSSEASSVTESSSETTTDTAPEFVYGDVDSNGKLEVVDISILIDKIINNTASVIAGITDVNNDNKVNTQDVAYILQKILDINYKLPCEEQSK